MRVLVAEDDLFLSMELVQSVEDAGHSPVAAVTSASRGLKAVAEHGADLALVDINLADGREAGLELARRLHADFGVETIFVSAREELVEKLRSSALGFIGKPYTREDIKGALSVAERVLHGNGVKKSDVPASLKLYRGARENGSGS